MIPDIELLVLCWKWAILFIARTRVCGQHIWILAHVRVLVCVCHLRCYNINIYFVFCKAFFGVFIGHRFSFSWVVSVIFKNFPITLLGVTTIKGPAQTPNIPLNIWKYWVLHMEILPTSPIIRQNSKYMAQ